MAAFLSVTDLSPSLSVPPSAVMSVADMASPWSCHSLIERFDAPLFFVTLRRNIVYALSALACLVIIAIVIPCTIFLQPSTQTEQPGIVAPETPEEEEPPHFGWTPNSIYSKESDLDEVNARLQGYRFNSDRVNGYIKLTFDKETDIPLYYTLGWDNFDKLDAGEADYMEQCEIYVVINEYFDGYPGWKEAYDTTLAINGLTVECRQKENHLPEEGIYGYICYGLIKTDDVRIYLTNYTYDSYCEKNGFETFVSELLIPISEAA